MNSHIYQKCLLVLSVLFSTTSLASTPIAIQRLETKQGTPVYFVEKHEVPIVDMAIIFNAGSAYDDKKPGLAALTNTLMNQGTINYNADLLAERFDNIGAQFSANTDIDKARLSLRSLSEPSALKTAADTFSDILAHPNFPIDAFTREKNRTLSQLKSLADDPSFLADQLFAKTLYEDTPYNHLPIGDSDSLKTIFQGDVIHFQRQYYVAKNAFIVIVGDLSKTRATEIANQFTKNMFVGEKAHVQFELPTAKSKSVTLNFPATQKNIRIGTFGIKRHDPDYFTLKVGNYILGGDPLSSLLGETLREKNGLTYGVTSQFASREATGPFVIAFSTQAQKAPEAISLTQKVLQTFVTSGPTDSQLQFAKQYLIGNFPLTIDSNAKILAAVSQIVSLQLPFNYLDTYVSQINKVTQRSVMAVMKRHLPLKQLITVSIGPSDTPTQTEYHDKTTER